MRLRGKYSSAFFPERRGRRVGVLALLDMLGVEAPLAWAEEALDIVRVRKNG